MRIRKMPNIKKYTKNLDGKQLKLFANELISDIVSRTQSGLDYVKHSFKTYTPKYAKLKKDKYGSSRPNLTQSGKMLNAITWKQIKGGIRLYFNSKEQNDKAHGNQVKNGRVFFKLNKQDNKKIVAKLKKIILK